MLKERILVPFPTSAANESTYEQIATDLQVELHKTRDLLNQKSLELAQANAHVAVLQSEREKKPIIPAGDIDEGYCCPNPWCTWAEPLTEDMHYCPGCGCEIDWRTSVAPSTSTIAQPYERSVETLMAWGRYSGQVHR